MVEPCFTVLYITCVTSCRLPTVLLAHLNVQYIKAYRTATSQHHRFALVSESKVGVVVRTDEE